MQLRIVYTFVLMVMAVLTSASTLYAAEAEVARSATDVLDSIRAAGKACPPTWSNATIANVERLDLPSGTWHLAHVTADGGPAGYMLLARRQDVFLLVMYSGSAFPANLAGAMDGAEVQGPPRPSEPFLGPMDKTWMIGDCGLTSPGGPKSFGPASAACCLASVLTAAEWEAERVPLLFLGHGNQYDSYWARLEPHLAASGHLKASIRDDPGRRGGSLPSEAAMERHKQYSHARLRIRRQAGQERSGVLDPRERGYTPTAQDYDRLAPVIFSLINNELSPFERYALLKDEESTARYIGQPVSKSEGTSRAIYLERAYLTRHGSVEQAVKRFAMARGLRVTVERKVLGALQQAELPCLLQGPAGEYILLVALSRGQDELWGLIVVPATVLPHKTATADLFGMSPVTGPSSHPGDIPALTPEWAERMKELEARVSRIPADQRRKAEAGERELAKLQAHRTSFVDPTSELPDCLSRGSHIVSLASLSGQWEALVLSNWAIGDNWDLD